MGNIILKPSPKKTESEKIYELISTGTSSEDIAATIIENKPKRKPILTDNQLKKMLTADEMKYIKSVPKKFIIDKCNNIIKSRDNHFCGYYIEVFGSKFKLNTLHELLEREKNKNNTSFNKLINFKFK